MTLKRAIFWLHLVVGLICGSVIALLAITGALYSFQAEILALIRQDVAQVTPSRSRGTTLDAIVEDVRQKNQGAPPSGLVVYADSSSAVQVMMGREKPSLYVNPYTGEIRRDSASGLSDFFAFTLKLHRWLAFEGAGRDFGAGVTGACSLALVFLSMSGLWLWWPNSLRWGNFKARAGVVKGAKGRLREWNLHNVIGFWGHSLILIVAGTGVIMSYRWASDLLYHTVGEAPPPKRERGEPPPGIKDGLSDAHALEPGDAKRPLGYDALLGKVEQEVPSWASISFRIPPGQGARDRVKREPSSVVSSAPGAPRSDSEPPVSVIVRRSEGLPLTASLTLTLDPYSGRVIKRDGFADKTPGNRLRAMVRPVHTGEGFGFAGKVLVFATAMAVLVLVYTGFALSLRRFSARRAKRHHQHRGDAREASLFSTSH